MKAKWLALCLAAALAAALTGCGKGDPAQSAQPTVDPQEIEQQQIEFDPGGTVLVNEGNLRITVDDLRQDEYGGVELGLLLENTSQRELTVSAASCSMNGYMTGVYFVCTVPAQGSALDTLTVYADELFSLGAGELADVAVSFNIDSADGDHRVTSPRSVTMPRAALYDYDVSLLQQALADPDWVRESGYRVLHSATGLYDRDGVSLPTACLVEDAFGARQLRLELANSSQEQTVVDLGRISLNGTELSAPNYGWYPIDPGKRYLVSVSLDYLIPDGAQEDYAQLREIGLAINGTAVQIAVPQ